MNQEQFIDLLNRYRKGLLTKKEKAILESWVTFGNFDGKVLSEQQLDQRLKVLANRLPLAGKHYRLWRHIAMAASIIFVLGIGVLFYRYNISILNFRKQTTTYADIPPGSNAATLTIGPGKTIPLSDAQIGVVIGKDGLAYNDGTKIEIAGQKTDGPSLQTISTPLGGTYQVTLADGTKVWLNAASSLTYPGNLNESKQRKVRLEGEGYFEVAKNKSHPFIVESKYQTLEVLGTHFNINSYTDETNTRTTLIEGSVRISPSGANKIVLKPGQQGIVDTDKANVIPVNVETAIDWKNGDFIFDGEDFKAIMRKIGRWYNVEIVYATDLTEHIELGGWMSRKSKLSTVLNRIERAGKLHFKIEGRKIIVEK